MTLARLLSLGGLRADRRWAASLAAVVAVSTALVASFPPAYGDAQDDAFRSEAAAAPSRERDLEVVQATRLPAPSLAASADERLEGVPPELGRLVDLRTTVVETPAYIATGLAGTRNPPGTARFLVLRAHDALREHVRWVAGTAPAAGDTLQVALTEAMAAALSVRPGDRLRLEPNPEQPQLASVPLSQQEPTAVEVSGIFAADAGDAYWFGDPRSLRPRVEETETERLVFAVGLLAPTAYEQLLAETGEMRLTYRWRYRVDARRLDAGALGRLEAATRSLELRYGAVAEAGGPVPEARTGIARVLERFREQQRLATASLSFAGAGFGGLALVVVLAAALAGGNAERRALTLVRDRGGRPSPAALLTASVVVAPAALVGIAAAAVVQRPDATGVLLAVGLAIVAVGTVAAVLAPRVRPPQDALAARIARERRNRRRAAVEATTVTVAAAAAVALRTRGDAPQGFDALAAATPVLVVLAAIVVALRAVPPLARLAGSALRRRDDLTPALAARRIERQGSAGSPPLVVPLVAAAVATFASLTIGGTGAATAPLLETVADALLTIAFAAVAYAAAAIVLTVIVLVRERRQDDGRLAALGQRRGGALAVGLAQFVPTIIAGTVTGAVAAAVAFAAVRPAFGAAEHVALGSPLVVALALLALPLTGAAAVAGSAGRGGAA